MAENYRVVRRRCRTLASWHNTTVNGVNIVEPPIRSGEICWREALAYASDARLKLRRLKAGRGVPSYRILPPPHSGPGSVSSGNHREILLHCNRYGMPTTEYGLKKLKGCRVLRGEELAVDILSRELGFDDSKGGGPFMVGFRVKTDYPFRGAGVEVYEGLGEYIGVAHAVTVVGLGEQSKWIDFGDGVLERFDEPYWIFQNAAARPDWGLGKIDCDQIIRAWIPEM